VVQRQRWRSRGRCIATTAVLVLDEATAALDLETEREVTRAIEALQGTRTVIVVAHRLSTVPTLRSHHRASRGPSRCVGTYADLLATDPNFRRLVEATETG
jgi:ABC-type transport system involved in cytochrome bd biosynthesis fused ATPase/permease subunit